MAPEIDGAFDVASRMLDDGAKVPDVERSLVALGLDVASAERVVEAVLRSRLPTPDPKPASPPCNWVAVTVALVVVVVAVVVGVKYAFMANDPTGVLVRAGGWGVVLRWAMVGGAAGAARGGLKVIHAQLLRLMD